MKRCFVLFFTVLLCVPRLHAAPPNILFIVMDDLGQRDLGCYGSTFYETPNMDRLAKEGMLFTDAYAACAVCSPTRASLMTGKYPVSVNITDYISPLDNGYHPLKGKIIDASYVKQLALEEFNIAEALGEVGYRTWHLGKWHLGNTGFYPDDQGFDLNVGGWQWGKPKDGYFSPWKISTLQDAEPGKHLDDQLTDDAIRLIQEQSDLPFFMNLWYYSVHTPIEAKPELIEKYRKKLQRLHLQEEEGVIWEGEPVPVIKNSHWNVRRRTAQTDPIYAAMMETADTNVGRVLDALKASGKERNTVVVLYSDNGGLSANFGAIRPPTCNAPLREGKAWGYEGGIRVPLIVRWPGRVESDSRCRVPVTSPDFYPTFMGVSGKPVPQQQAVEGVSILPLLDGGTLPVRPIFWHYPHYGNGGATPYSAVRQGDWKLIEFFEDGHLELYNLKDDLSESVNLAKTHPEHVQKLYRILKGWRASRGAKLPQINPDWKEPGNE